MYQLSLQASQLVVTNSWAKISFRKNDSTM